MNISENSRIWIYQSDRAFSPAEEQAVRQQLNEFTGQWKAHGQELLTEGTVLYGRFIVIAVDEQQAEASGCSIDSSTRLIKDLEKKLGVDLFNRFNMAYRIGDEVISCSREEFEQLISEGKITEDTIVFNNLIQTAGELKNSWEIPFKESWHARVFTLSPSI